MMIAGSILVGIFVSGVLYRVLFYDLADFMDGLIKLLTVFLVKRRQWPFAPWQKPIRPEDFEDEGWSSGIRFFSFLALSLGSAYYTYGALHKYFE